MSWKWRRQCSAWCPVGPTTSWPPDLQHEHGDGSLHAALPQRQIGPVTQFQQKPGPLGIHFVRSEVVLFLTFLHLICYDS